MGSITHPGIQALPDQPVVILKTGQQAYLAHYYEGGSIDSGLAKIGEGLSEDELRNQRFDFSLQLILGLKRAHDLGIRHGDIKPTNCLLEKGVCVLADWGGARLLKDEKGIYNWSTLEWSGSTFGFYSNHDMQEHARLAKEAISLLNSAGIRDEATYKQLLEQALTDSQMQTSQGVNILKTVRKIADLLEEMAKILYAQDIYALGKLYRENLLGDVGINKKAVELIERMCVEDYKQRITLPDLQDVVEY